MAISNGYTDDQVREFVYAYERQPFGTKLAWLRQQNLSQDRLFRWRNAIFDGDLARGLVPREGSHMTSPTARRKLAKQHHAQETENQKLRARVHELEQANEALGKAIGLLHQLNEHEPDTPETTKPNGS